MKRIVSTAFVLLTAIAASAQTMTLNSFSNGGGAVLTPIGSSNPMHVGVIGQPIASGFTSGMLVVSNIMYANDLHPPIITLDPSSVSIRLEQSNSISYQATDNDEITSNKLYYKPIGAVGNFESVDVADPVTNTFTKSILPAWHDRMGMEYYVEVKDQENTTRHPPGAGTHFVYSIHPEPQIPTTLLSYGRTKNNYRIICIPYHTSDPITQIFEELGPSDKSKYRIYKWQANEWKEYPSFTTMNRGEGYFIIMSDRLSNVVLKMPEQQAPANNQSDLFELSLTPGWNLIGNPYTIGINWSDIIAYNNSPDALGSELKVWTENGQYENINELVAHQGAFVWLDGTEPLQLLVSFNGQTADNATGRKANDNKVSAWKVNLTVQEGIERNAQAAFGMHSLADLSFDRYDDLNPPSFDPFLTVKFNHPEHSQQHFVRDIVPLRDIHAWDMEIPSLVNTDRYLSWTTADMSAISTDLLLYDVDGNTVIDMKQNSEYRFPSSSKRFKILYGPREQAEIRPDYIVVLPPYPNPIKKGQHVIFSIGLPETDRNYPVYLDLFDALGHVVYQTHWTLSAGIHELLLPPQEAPENAGEIFYYRLQIGNNRHTGKLIYKP